MDNANIKFPAEALFKYPHMFPLDIKIWERFLVDHGPEYISISYDVKAGSGVPIPDGTPENYARMQEILSKYRIDAIGFRNSQIDIIEVKPDAGTIAIGQIVTYVTLYKRDFAPTLPVRGVIVTNRELPDIRYLTETQGFDYYIV